MLCGRTPLFCKGKPSWVAVLSDKRWFGASPWRCVCYGMAATQTGRPRETHVTRVVVVPTGRPDRPESPEDLQWVKSPAWNWVGLHGITRESEQTRGDAYACAAGTTALLVLQGDALRPGTAPAARTARGEVGFDRQGGCKRDGLSRL